MKKIEALEEVLKQLEKKSDEATKKGNWVLLCYTEGQISVIKKMKEVMEEKNNE